MGDKRKLHNNSISFISADVLNIKEYTCDIYIICKHMFQHYKNFNAYSNSFSLFSIIFFYS